ncbi:MAG: TetR/AcrR family transcriptional regulator [Hyphomonadaceae bacterium]
MASSSTSSLQRIARTRPLTARGANTRKCLLDGIVRLLSQKGLAFTTVQLLSDETGVSRGSILHQFPTRLDMLHSACEMILDEIIADLEADLARRTDPWARLKAFSDITWRQTESANWTALSEIYVGARWDEELAARIRPAKDRMYDHIEEIIRGLASSAGIKDASIISPHVFLVSAAMRGLLADLAVHNDKTSILASVDLLRANYASFIDSLRAELQGTKTREKKKNVALKRTASLTRNNK